ncbi:MAG TPA: polysaccharide deacetylase family protein [Ferruginibacter sp.]|jgi:peptidoglycan/xylan/chitin deacetylase (PgdA/CDA1 family)|nr:polysaccharide deacetylase family protein [Ferruginibacter sp.]
MFYFVKTPWWLKLLYPTCIWQVKDTKKIIYLTFDDGPHPTITPFVLDELKKYRATATFFCIGKNVVQYNDIYRRITTEGHTIANHTHNHLNGWKTNDDVYVENIAEAKKHIDSALFRPPYGRIKKSQLKRLATKKIQSHIIMWSVLSGDFDKKLTPEKCLANVINNAKNGSIVVFHDSEKAFERLRYALPVVLEYFSTRGFSFEKIDADKLQRDRQQLVK